MRSYGRFVKSSGRWGRQNQHWQGRGGTTDADAEDVIAPTIQSLSPADNATSVAVDAAITATFDENIQFGTGTIDIYDASDDSLIESFNVETEVGTDPGEVSISGAVLTITPTDDLPYNTGIYIQIDATAIDDLANNSFAGIANETTWNFTTVLPTPVLTWVSDETDSTPDFEITEVPLALAVVGNKAEVQIDDTSSAFGSIEETYTYDVEAGDESDLTLSITGAAALANGTKWARGRMLDSGDVPITLWSDTITFDIDASAYIPTYPYLMFG